MKQDEFDNALLILRCQKNEEKAFKELLEKWERRLYYYFKRILQDETAVWDVLQEIWLTVSIKLKTLYNYPIKNFCLT